MCSGRGPCCSGNRTHPVGVGLTPGDASDCTLQLLQWVCPPDTSARWLCLPTLPKHRYRRSWICPSATGAHTTRQHGELRELRDEQTGTPHTAGCAVVTRLGTPERRDSWQTYSRRHQYPSGFTRQNSLKYRRVWETHNHPLVDAVVAQHRLPEHTGSRVVSDERYTVVPRFVEQADRVSPESLGFVAPDVPPPVGGDHPVAGVSGCGNPVTPTVPELRKPVPVGGNGVSAVGAPTDSRGRDTPLSWASKRSLVLVWVSGRVYTCHTRG